VRNYFNYFTEVEEHFVRKRGKNITVAPLDWCLIELWKSSGIPLHVALRGIDRSFEAAQKRQRKNPSTLFYCHPAVMEAFEEYRNAMIGAQPDQVTEAAGEKPMMPSAAVVAHLDQLLAALSRLEAKLVERETGRLRALRAEAEARAAVDPEELDRELTEIEELLADALRERLAPERLAAIRAEVKDETKIYKKHLSKEMYERLRNGYLRRKLLAENGIPEFTIIHLEL
jgi:hypothetical protein